MSWMQKKGEPHHPLPAECYIISATSALCDSCRTLASKWDASWLTGPQQGTLVELSPLTPYDIQHRREVLQDLVSEGEIMLYA